MYDGLRIGQLRPGALHDGEKSSREFVNPVIIAALNGLRRN